MAKRFYKAVTVGSHADGFQVLLDGRVLKTPGKKPLNCRTQIQAELVAAEWDAQEEEIKPETMPCTRLINVACEQTPSRRIELIAEFRKYCETDLLCYRTSTPRDLADRQQNQWQPVLDWSAKHHNVRLATTTGLEAVPQPETSLRSAEHYAEALDDIALTILLHFTASFGSSVLALAVLEKYLSVDDAFSLSCLDETFQNERWGADDEAVARNTALLAELTALANLN